MMRNEGRFKLVMIASLTLLTVIYIILFSIRVYHENTMKTVEEMRVYLSKSKQTIPRHLSVMRDELKSLEVVEYLGGKYSPEPLKGCEIMVTIINVPDSHTIGRGQFQEIDTANNSGLLVEAVYITEDSIELFSIEGMDKLESGNWQQYANLEIGLVQSFKIGTGEFEEYLED